jgi:hypothetical protein
MQVRAMRLEPRLGSVGFGKQAARHAPKGGRVIHMDEMRDFVSSEIFEHEGRRKNKPPGKIERAGR